MNRRTMILGSIGAAVGIFTQQGKTSLRLRPACEPAPKQRQKFTAPRKFNQLCFTIDADDAKMVAAFRRMQRELDALRERCGY